MGYAVIVISVILADQGTKYLIETFLQFYEVREIIPGFFNLVFVTNTGAAFSLFADVASPWRHYFFVSIAVFAAVALTIGYIKLKKVNRLYCYPMALIAGGALGNLIDRVRIGAVIDFLDFHYLGYHWPAFNVADSAICIGAGLFIVLNISDAKKQNLSEAK